MILILRKIKRALLGKGQVRNYLLYALGEIVLVVIGILIALQINNWNSEKQKEASLQSYLGSIARNIHSDLNDAQSIRSRRASTIELTQRAMRISPQQSLLDIEEVAFASYALQEASELLYFNANMSGYEALKSSGVLDRLQGRDIENLLYDYYDTVSRISQDEASHNEYLRLLTLNMMVEWPKGREEWEFMNPSSLSPERLQELQPFFKDLLRIPSLRSLYSRAEAGASLLLEYDRLDLLGRAFIRMVENDLMKIDEPTQALLESIYDPGQGKGYAHVLSDGHVYWPNYTMLYTDSFIMRHAGNSLDIVSSESTYSLDTMEQREDCLHVSYPGGADWASLFLRIRGASNKRTCQDFSQFDTLLLELKGDVPGETLIVNLKDQDDPDDGNQTNVELILTDQWQTYEINLSEFKTADLSKLHVVLAFLFLNEPQSFSVRTIRYL